MAKQSRGSVRPGQRRPSTRKPAGARTPAPTASTAPATPRASGLTESEEARAAELEQQLLAQERQAEASRTRAKERATRDTYSGGTLAVRAEQEYAYVARDVRRIGEMAVIMLVILIGLWVLIDIAKVIPVG